MRAVRTVDVQSRMARTLTCCAVGWVRWGGAGRIVGCSFCSRVSMPGCRAGCSGAQLYGRYLYIVFLVLLLRPCCLLGGCPWRAGYCSAVQVTRILSLCFGPLIRLTFVGPLGMVSSLAPWHEVFTLM